MIKWEQMVFEGNPEYGCELQPIDFVTIARGFGAGAVHIDDPAQCGALLDQALAMPGPTVVEAVIDPFVPPMPPKISLEQAKHFASALAKGEPNREQIAWTVLKDKVREMV
jgi:pyruvate dehydrogenase (quinone)/pyruvate oxidase